MRVAGLALIGLGVAAGIAGTAVALSGNDAAPVASPTSVSAPASPTTSAESSVSASPAPPTSSSEAPSSSSSAPVSSPPPAQAPPPQSSQAPDAPQNAANSAAKWVTLRIYNNSTIKGLAARAGDEFRSEGWTVAEVSNYAAGVIPTTTAYYRPGTDEETAAKSLAATFGMRAEPRFEGIQNSNPGVIIIVTNDYQNAGKSK
jgi:hypothetical protein